MRYPQKVLYYNYTVQSHKSPVNSTDGHSQASVGLWGFCGLGGYVCGD